MLCRADKEGQAAGGSDQAPGRWEDGFEALDGSEGHDVEPCVRDGFGAGDLYIDVCQCKGPGDFAEEGGLLVVRFDEG